MTQRTETALDTLITDTITTNGNNEISGSDVRGILLDMGDSLSFRAVEINTQTDSYTLVLADATKYVRMNKGTACTLTVPLNSTVAFPTGTQILIRQVGAGQVTVAAAGGVTITTAQTLLLRAQHSSASLVKVDTDTWELAGDLEAV